MTRKHFEAIAHTLKMTISNPQDRYRTASELAGFFKAENPRFKAELFLKACARTDGHDESYVGTENPFAPLL